jgi:hypothetical protein
MKLIKVVADKKKVSTITGKEYFPSYYALVLDNGAKILIKPCYKDDYAKLDLISEKIVKAS